MLFLSICLIVIILSVYMTIKFYKKKKALNNNKIVSTNNNVLEEKTHTISYTSANSMDDRRELLYEKFQERTKNRNYHIVACFLHAAIDLENITDFYDFEKKVEQYNVQRKELLLLTGYEFYAKQGIKLYNQLCNDGVYTTRKAKKSDLKIINEHKPLKDLPLSMEQIYDNFEAHWNDVLKSYKSRTAYYNRLEYLITYISELERKPYLSAEQCILFKLQHLKNSYSELLKSKQ